MPDRVHSEFPQNKRMLAREILQSQQVTFEVTLIVKVNVETAKIGILRQQIFRRWVCGIGKEGIRIDSTAYANPVPLPNSITRRAPSQRAIVLEISLPTR